MRTRLLVGALAAAAAMVSSMAAPALAADPDSTVLSGPTGVVATGDATFTFSGDDGTGSPATSFECKLDYSAWMACNSPQSYLSLPDAAHTLYVRALGPSGADPTPASQSWTVDVAGPNTSIDSGPTGFVADTDATFTFSGTDAMSAVDAWGGAGTGDGQFTLPYSIALTASGEMLVADSANNRVQRFAADGTYLSQFGSLGSAPGQLNTPYGVAVDAAGDIYVTDGANNRVQKFDATGNYLFEWGTAGNGDGQFNSPRGIAIGSSGDIFVADVYNHRIQKFDASGNFLGKWGSNGVADGQFKYPFGVAVGNGGSVYIADYNNSRIQRFDAGGNFLGKWGTYGAGNGQLKYPYGVSTDAAGNVYVADTYNYRIQVFDATGIYISQFGTRGAANGHFSLPYNSAITASGDIYVVDLGVNRVERFSAAVDSFECQLDGGGWSACTSPVSHTGLAEGAHTLETRAIDQAGSPDPTPPSRSWIVDTTDPTVTIDTYPPDPSASTDADFTFSGDDGTGSGVASLECQLDGGGWAACTSPVNYTSLAYGLHTFEVKATDNVGNPGPPASYAWAISSDADTNIAVAPPAVSGSADAAFEFTGDDGTGAPATAFECSIDASAWSPCTTPTNYTGVSEGPHTFAVRSFNFLGDPDPTPASHSWTVDLTPPATSITVGPTGLVATPDATLTFTGDDGAGSGVASFECQLDGGGWSICTSPQDYTALADGPHTFDVRALDDAGNVDATPASRSWTIDATAPDTSITGGPSGTVTSSGPGAASFTFAGDDGTGSGIASFECQLDAGAWTGCTSPTSYMGLAGGAHTFGVRALDNAGNLDASLAARTWTVAVCTATGTAGADVLTGTAGVDVICGLGGDDTIAGLGGNDVLDGGTGIDTLNYGGSATAVSVDLSTGTATGTSIGTDTLIAGENITGSGAADTLTGDANANVINAGAGADTIAGGTANDTLRGANGGDTIEGDLGDDAIDGGNQTDTVSYQNAPGDVVASLATGTSSGAAGADTLANVENLAGSTIGNDTLTGAGGAQTIQGLGGSDTIAGLAGNDTLQGGAGADTVTYATAGGAVNVNLTTGTATGAGTDALSTLENVIGSGNADTINGDGNANLLWGGIGADNITAQAGDDSLYGEAGNDNLNGGLPNSGLPGDLCVQGAGTGTLTSCEVIV